MGKQITYERRPSGPRAAKVAWSQFEGTYGKPPKAMRFDSEKGEWVGAYEEEERRLPVDAAV